MSTFNLTLFEALRSAGVDEVHARKVVEEFEKNIDARYLLHKEILATKADIAELKSTTTKELADLKVDLIKFIVGAMIAQGGLIVALIKLLQP
jgi:hypothetical protein